ncbi:hypothetical protein [Luteibaculum oceani]|uniref:Uncharacterized protein n=1 Tax=Luteibaculum oceani TaxID=1294296 RepID=A0A5C6UVD6_9FLAO|nr:hypothetical protein [Luteibaculum oceani]TXC76211.1 hypothetical protein FRX97_10705 [Luteibaculum oceani]
MGKRIFTLVAAIMVALITYGLLGALINYLIPTPEELMNSTDPAIVMKRVNSVSPVKWTLTVIGFYIAFVVGHFTHKAILGVDKVVKIAFTVLFLSLPIYLFYVIYPWGIWAPIPMFIGAILIHQWLNRAPNDKLS